MRAWIPFLGALALALMVLFARCGTVDSDPCEDVDCDDQIECTDDRCDSTSGECTFIAVPEDTVCDFGGLPGLCKSGVCQDAEFCKGKDCDDENPCTKDECIPATGECRTTAVVENTPCDFGGLPGLCMSGECEDARLCDGVFCDDENDCTEDLCIPMTGDCGHPAVPDEAPCDFGGLPGVCASGVCEDAALCDGVVCDGNPCVLDPPPCDPFTGRCPAPTAFVAAGTLCDFATVNDGRCDGFGHCIEPQGDLEPVGISFDANHRLQVTIRNRSTDLVPPNLGKVRVFVDGTVAAEIPLETLSDDSYRQPYSRQAITLEARVAGQNRRIAVAVDTDDEILERNEDHNQYTRTITPPMASGPDLVVGSLSADVPSGTLSAEIRNDGTLQSPAVQVELEIRSGGVLVQTVTRTLPALNANDGCLIDASLGAPIQPGSKVQVTLRTGSALDEIDTTNQSRTAFFPPESALDGYHSILLHPKISGNLKWENASGVTSLTSTQTTDLFEKIRQLELERSVVAPLPSVRWPVKYSESEAWEIFAVNVAHALWVEKHGLVAWRLADMSDDQVGSILDGRKWFSYAPDSNDYAPLYGSITPRNPSASYDFLRGFGMIESSQLETIHALTEWARSRLMHASGQDWLEQYGYAGLPPVDRILFPLAGRLHITPGCLGTTGIYVSVLRAINIPADRAFILLVDSMHCRPDFPAVHHSMPHGDDPYSAILANASQSVPIEMVLYTDAEMSALFLEPIPDCSDGFCNTVGQQACHNMVRYQILRSFDARGDYLPHQYLMYGPEHLRDGVLHGIPIGGEFVTYVRPLFSESEKEAIISSVEDHLTKLGAGDIEQGEAIVSARVSDWNNAKTSDFWSEAQRLEQELAVGASFMAAGCAP